MKIVEQEVTCLDFMGTDLSVVNAARVSMYKQSVYLHDDYGEDFLKLEDTKLLNYLAKHKHWTPFAHCFLSFRIKAPIFVARQLAKHQVGLVWNEVSRRYVSDEPEFYVPDKWRLKADNVKQGSGEDHNNQLECEDVYDYFLQEALYNYQYLINTKVCPEQARMLLPQSMMTEWIWSGSLLAFNRICSLRLDTHTQKETQEVAKKLNDYCKKYFPESWDALTTYANI